MTASSDSPNAPTSGGSLAGGSTSQLVSGGAIGKYRVIASLGHGGMADVFLTVAQGPMGFNKLAVVKKLRAPIADDGEALEMFFDEARLAARLAHPNVVHTYEVGEDNGAYFIAMEYLEGQALNKVARAPRAQQSGPLFTRPMWAWIMAEALKGLHYAHEATDFDGTPLNIVHRDVSPHNIFVTYGGQVKIVDFGIAKAALNATHTQDGILKGKISYMSPEQARGLPVDRRSDVFAAGIVLWELLAERRLLGGDQVAILHRLLNEEMPPLASVMDIDPVLDAIVCKALQRRPDDRFQNAHEMQVELERYVRTAGVAAGQFDVSAAMTAVFKDVREGVKRQIQVQLATAGGGSLRDLPAFAGTNMGTGSGSGASGDHPLSLTPSRPSLKWASDGGRPSQISQAPFIAATSLVPKVRRYAPVAALGALVFAAGVVLAAVMTRQPPKAPVATASTGTVESNAVATDTGLVDITSTPSGAAVSWNGTPIGRTPLQRRIPGGTHAFVATLDGWPSETLIVELPAGGHVSRSVTFATAAPVELGDSPAPRIETLPRVATARPASAAPRAAVAVAAPAHRAPTPEPPRTNANDVPAARPPTPEPPPAPAAPPPRADSDPVPVPVPSRKAAAPRTEGDGSPTRKVRVITEESKKNSAVRVIAD